MQTLLLRTFVGVSIAISLLIPTLAQSTPSNRNYEQPNLSFKVDRRSGNCPKTVNLWSLLLPLEGGADHIAVADTLRFANTARVTRSNSRFVEYEAPLKREFASCVGRASSSEFRAYQFQFHNRRVYFQVNPAIANSKTAIVARRVASGRPYVFWQARE